MTAIPTSTRQWLLREKPTGFPLLEGEYATFELNQAEIPPLGPSQVILKTLYLSNDPAQRGWISAGIDKKRLYTDPVEIGQTMRSYGIAEVIHGTSEIYPRGSLVIVSANWTEYSIHDEKDCRPVKVLPGLRPTHFMGSFGLPALTAYYGLNEVVLATKDDTVVVSGAAGATGSMAVQIAKKLIGCKRVGRSSLYPNQCHYIPCLPFKVIGIAGTEEKCRWVEHLGADLCLDYKSPTFQDDLIRATEDYVEVYFGIFSSSTEITKD